MSVQLQALPAVVLAGITLYVGLSHLILCRRHMRRRHHFLFALTCTLVAAYDLFAAALYNSTSVREGAVWQRAQFATLALVALALVWFVHDYTFRRSKRTFFVFAAALLLLALLTAVGPKHWVLLDQPAVKIVALPLGGRVTYYESAPGPLLLVQTAVGFAAFLYSFVIAAQGYRYFDRVRYRPLFVAMGIFCAGVVNDACVATGVYSFVYLIEVAYMGMVVLMAVSMSRELANATAEQEHLRAIEQRFSAVFRNAAVGIGLLRPGKTFITANAAMCGMLGRTAREMPGLRLEECVHPQDDAKLNRVFDAIVRGETDAYRAEHRYLQPGNQPYWGDMSFAPVLSPGGAVTAMLWIIVGITERKRTAQALQRLNEELEEQVAQRTTELKDANVKLSRSLDKLREDEEAGRMIQFNLLPEERRRIGPYAFSRYLAPSFYVSGDFVDYFDVGERHVAFYMADVSGHGVSSAFITVLLHTLIINNLDHFTADGDTGVLDPAAMLRKINGELVRHGGGKHITIFYGVLDRDTNTLTYANGGHFPPPLLYRDGQVETVTAPGPAVGLFDFSTFENATRDMPDRFVLAVFSDGVLEVLPQATLTEKQTALAAMLDRETVDIEDLVQRTGLHAAGSLPDDVTMLMIKRDGSHA